MAPHPLAHIRIPASQGTKYIGARLFEAVHGYVADKNDEYLRYFTLLVRLMIHCGDIKGLVYLPGIWERNSHTDRKQRLQILGDVIKQELTRYIQARWKRAVTNPEYTVCRRRIEYEFAQMGPVI